MADLIDRQAALEIVRKHIGVKGNKAYLIDVGKTFGEIIKLPSAEPERKKGKWLVDGYDATCSVCKTIYCGEWHDLDLIVDCQYNYCPNCGADMRGET